VNAGASALTSRARGAYAPGTGIEASPLPETGRARRQWDARLHVRSPLGWIDCLNG
jgi:hypothetical protein